MTKRPKAALQAKPATQSAGRYCAPANGASNRHKAAAVTKPRVRGGEADGRNFANISIVYDGQILGVCLSRGRCRSRLLDQEDLLRH